MRGTTLAVFLVVCVGIAVALPWNERRGGRIHQNDGEEGLYPSSVGRTRPVSPRRSVNAIASSPYYYFRSPRYVSQGNEQYLPVAARRGYRVYRKDQRSEESEEEDDDVADDDDQDEDEPEDDQFDTPTWERLFPREEQGSQGGPPPSGYGGGSQQGGRPGSGPPPSSGGGYSGSQQGSGPPPSGYAGGQGQQEDSYEAILPTDPRYSQFGGSGGQGGGPGRSGLGGPQYNRVRPMTVRVVRPRQYSAVPVSKKSWAVYNPQVEGRQYTVRRSSRLQPYQYVYAQPSASRRWAYQRAEQVPQYVYQPRPVYRRASSPVVTKVWGRQRRSKN